MTKPFNEQEFNEALNNMDFGTLDRWTIEQNAKCNAADADDPTACAIATAAMYIDQNCEYLD